MFSTICFLVWGGGGGGVACNVFGTSGIQGFLSFEAQAFLIFRVLEFRVYRAERRGV